MDSNFKRNCLRGKREQKSFKQRRGEKAIIRNGRVFPFLFFFSFLLQPLQLKLLYYTGSVQQFTKYCYDTLLNNKTLALGAAAAA